MCILPWNALGRCATPVVIGKEGFFGAEGSPKLQRIRATPFMSGVLSDYAIVTSNASGWQNGESFYRYCLDQQLRSVAQGGTSLRIDDGSKCHLCTRKRKDGTVEYLCEGKPVDEWLVEKLQCYSWKWAPNYSRLSPNDRPGCNLLFRHRYDLEMRSLMAQNKTEMKKNNQPIYK